MLDINLLRNDFEAVEKALSTRNEEFDLSQFKGLDEKRRALLGEVEALKSEKNNGNDDFPKIQAVENDIEKSDMEGGEE